METRPLKKRRGSALAISLIVAASLGVLLTLASARWKVLRQRAEDAVLHEILENAALDMLERVTAWTAEQKPANPSDKTYDGVELTSEDGLDTLAIELPEPLRRSVSGGAALTSALHWCVFTGREARWTGIEIRYLFFHHGLYERGVPVGTSGFAGDSYLSDAFAWKRGNGTGCHGRHPHSGGYASYGTILLDRV